MREGCGGAPIKLANVQILSQLLLQFLNLACQQGQRHFEIKCFTKKKSFGTSGNLIFIPNSFMAAVKEFFQFKFYLIVRSVVVSVSNNSNMPTHGEQVDMSPKDIKYFVTICSAYHFCNSTQ